MKPVTQPDSATLDRPAPTLWDTLIRVGLIGALAVLCYRIFSPFLSLTVSSIILAVAIYPLHQWVARKIGADKSWRQRSGARWHRFARHPHVGANGFIRGFGRRPRQRSAGKYTARAATPRESKAGPSSVTISTTTGRRRKRISPDFYRARSPKSPARARCVFDRRGHRARHVVARGRISHRQHRDGLRRLSRAQWPPDLLSSGPPRSRQEACGTCAINDPSRWGGCRRRGGNSGAADRAGANDRGHNGVAGVLAIVTLVFGIAQVPAIILRCR